MPATKAIRPWKGIMWKRIVRRPGKRVVWQRIMWWPWESVVWKSIMRESVMRKGIAWRESIVPGAVVKCSSLQSFQLFFRLNGILFLACRVPDNERANQHYKDMKFVHTKYGLYTN